VNGYCLKGGVAMELRLARRARAAKDLDLVPYGDHGTRLASFDRALRLGFGRSLHLAAPPTAYFPI
jgi:hypothetical protein